jgi:hypothetical protein
MRITWSTFIKTPIISVSELSSPLACWSSYLWTMPPESDCPVYRVSHSLLAVRLIHYPAVERKALVSGAAARIPAHSDYGSITILFQDAVGGLQVEDSKNPGNYCEWLLRYQNLECCEHH